MPQPPGAVGLCSWSTWQSWGAWDPIGGAEVWVPCRSPTGPPTLLSLCYHVIVVQKYLSMSLSSVTPGNAPNLSVTPCRPSRRPMSPGTGCLETSPKRWGSSHTSEEWLTSQRAVQGDLPVLRGLLLKAHAPRPGAVAAQEPEDSPLAPVAWTQHVGDPASPLA